MAPTGIMDDMAREVSAASSLAVRFFLSRLLARLRRWLGRRRPPPRPSEPPWRWLIPGRIAVRDLSDAEREDNGRAERAVPRWLDRNRRGAQGGATEQAWLSPTRYGRERLY